MSSRSNKNRNRQSEVAHEPPHGAPASNWEWVCAAIGVLLVLGTVGFIGYEALTREPAVPDVTVEHIGTEQASGGYIVRFSARNTGPATAAALSISGELLDATAVIESSEAVLDYLPSNAERQGGLIFQNDPARYELKLTAKGYFDP